MKTIQMTMDGELIERIDARVKRLGTTRSAFAREALREALRRLDIDHSEAAMDTTSGPATSGPFRSVLTRCSAAVGGTRRMDYRPVGARRPERRLLSQRSSLAKEIERGGSLSAKSTRLFLWGLRAEGAVSPSGESWRA